MKYLMILTVGVCLLFATVPAVADQAADEAAVREANEQRIAVWNAKDVKAYLAFFDEGCKIGFNGNPCAAADPAGKLRPEPCGRSAATHPRRHPPGCLARRDRR